jgi:hypothetical protein
MKTNETAAYHVKVGAFRYFVGRIQTGTVIKNSVEYTTITALAPRFELGAAEKIQEKLKRMNIESEIVLAMSEDHRKQRQDAVVQERDLELFWQEATKAAGGKDSMTEQLRKWSVTMRDTDD